MTTKEHLSKHDREIAEIRAIQKRTDESIAKMVAHTDESITKMASANAREKAEIWILMGKLAKGTEAAQQETRVIRREIRDLNAAIQNLAVAQKRTEAALRAFAESLRGGNGHRKRNIS